MHVLKKIYLAAVLLALIASMVVARPAASQDGDYDWRRDWAVVAGFAVELDTQGYQFPTAIAFIPNPGSGPNDPLYFVTEVRGQVKVITNDRTVHTFAEKFLQTEFTTEAPNREAEFGAAGICLDAERGYVFVTFAYQDENKVLHNNIVRFQSEPGTFSLQPSGQTAFTEVFARYPTGPSHQIGGCQVQGDHLFVGVGDGFNSPRGSQQLDTIHGKLLRMTLDGRPVPDNPFYQDSDVQKSENYIWAYGLRNPFSLKLLGQRVFVTDNGPDLDRFLEIQKGVNYLWDGSDQSVAASADVVIVPSRSPVQMDYYPKGSPLFPDAYRDQFYISVASFDAEQGRLPGILLLEYGLDEHRALSAPATLLQYLGSTEQGVVGLAFGPDGLYFAPIMPNAAGVSAVFKITYEPAGNYPFHPQPTREPIMLMYEKGCLGCHSIEGQLKGGTAGPRLDQAALMERLQTQLTSDAYRKQIEAIEQLDQEPQRSYAAARKEVLAAQGLDRIHTWIKYRVQEPKFDNAYTQMPNLGVTPEEAEVIATFLTTLPNQSGGPLPFLPEQPRYPHVALAFGSGLGLGVIGLFAAQWARRRFQSARAKKVADEG
ncbi:MAG: PQQ-dependent sugar dehydrogenase [Anaerolineales bacterium]